MPGEAELIMFAIRSAIKLGQQSREAYVDATRRQTSSRRASAVGWAE